MYYTNQGRNFTNENIRSKVQIVKNWCIARFLMTKSQPVEKADRRYVAGGVPVMDERVAARAVITKCSSRAAPSMGRRKLLVQLCTAR